jgi:DeoR/GlpR family transcriptional regulator of sugar metabolism
LRPDLAATIITHSPVTAAALTDHPAADVIILGGRLHKRSSCACGAAAAEAASGITADLFLLVVAGIHPKAGLSSGPSRRTPSSACQRSRVSSPTRPPATPPCGSCATQGVTVIQE